MLFIRQSYGGDDTGEKTRNFNGVRCMSAKMCNFAYDNSIYNRMKKWQKILGGTTLAILLCVELFLFGIYYGVIDCSLWRLHLQSNYPIESEQFAINVISIMMWGNLILALTLFICLWKKGGKR